MAKKSDFNGFLPTDNWFAVFATTDPGAPLGKRPLCAWGYKFMEAPYGGHMEGFVVVGKVARSAKSLPGFLGYFKREFGNIEDFLMAAAEWRAAHV